MGTTRRASTTVAVAAALGAVVTGCGSGTAQSISAAADADLATWSAVGGATGAGLQAENPADLSEAARAADVVVVGRFAGTGGAIRTFEGSPGDVVRYMTVEVIVERTLAGSRRDTQRADQLALEIVLDGGASAAEVLSTLPRSQAIFFLRNKATSAEMFGAKRDTEVEAQYYRLLRADALIVRGADGRARPVFDDQGEAGVFDVLAGRPFAEAAQYTAELYARDKHLGKPKSGAQ